MTAMRRRVVVVCGYGCNLESPLKPYLDRVARFCERAKPDHIILCGGATQRKLFPSRTEAGLMQEYLARTMVIPITWTPSWHTLADSYTTYENIRDAANLINGMNRSIYISTEITIFCEVTRSLSVVGLARKFLGFPPAKGEEDIRIKTDSWERAHPLKMLWSTIKTYLAIYLPWLNTLQRRSRIAKSKVC